MEKKEKIYIVGSYKERKYNEEKKRDRNYDDVVAVR